jgi:lipopolysaccharide biosynthesis glycosyltransferase
VAEYKLLNYGGLQMKSDEQPIVITLACDDDYALPTGVVLHSLLQNLKHNTSTEIFIINGGISLNNQDKLRRITDVTTHDIRLRFVSPNMNKMPSIRTTGHLTSAAYLRLTIEHVIPEKYSRAIYLDSDLLVETDLNDLWNSEMGDYTLLAVQDFLVPNVASPGGLLRFRELGFDPEAPYFNAGVLVLNLTRWRQEKIAERVFEYLLNHQNSLTLGDQEGLNAVLANSWRKLKPNWNIQSSVFGFNRWANSTNKQEIEESYEDILASPYIWHFTGPLKPWHEDLDHPAKTDWRQNLYSSGWFQDNESGSEYSSISVKTFPNLVRDSTGNPAITIVVPSYKRRGLIRECLESVLQQEYSDFQLVVIDNDPSGTSRDAVLSYDDNRISYLQNESNIGLLGNWNRALEFRSSPYLV